MKRHSYVLILLSLIAFSCTKDKKDSGSESHKNIYALGWKVNANNSPLPFPVYWKEGKEITLGDTKASASSISLNGSDIYITGQIDNKPVFWKNGIVNYLPITSKEGTAISISFNNEDIYILGSEEGQFTIWKNGSIFKQLPKFQEYKSVVLVKDMVHYLVRKNKGGNSVTEYWKNDVPTEIVPFNNTISKLAISNDDIYLSGTNEKQSEIYIWKNNLQTTIETAADTARIQLQLEGLYIDGADVYVIYYEVDIINKSYVVKYWKNGTLNILATPKNFDLGNFKVIGGKFYYSGVDLNYSPIGGGALYFINETVHYLNKENYSGVDDIAVKL